MYNIDYIQRQPELYQRLRDVLAATQGDLAWPRSAKFKLTSRCNLRCVMCKYWRGPRGEEVDTETAISVLRGLAEMGCRKVHFSGGEVLTRPDFMAVLEAAVGLGMKANFTTNGTLVTKDIARQLAKLRVNSVAVSFDGGDAKTHDRMRGVEGAFKAARKGAALVSRYARKGMPKLRINMVLTRNNYHAAPDVLRLAHELGAVDVHPMPVDAKGQEKIRLSKAHMRDYKANVVPEVRALREEFGFSTAADYVYPFGRSKDETNFSKQGLYARGYYDEHLCHVPWLHTFIEWSGDVYLCCMARGHTEPLGNVRETPIAEILTGERYASVRRQFMRERLEACARCDNFLAENRALHSALSHEPAEV